MKPTETALSVTQAAEAAGVARSTIWKAYKAGKISATNLDKQLWIEPVELLRHYPQAEFKNQDSETGNVSGNVSAETVETIGNGSGNSVLSLELKFLRERLELVEKMGGDERARLMAHIEELRGERDHYRDQQDGLIATIKEQASSLRLLTDQRQQAVITPVPPMSAAPEASSRRGLFGLFRR